MASPAMVTPSPGRPRGARAAAWPSTDSVSPVALSPATTAPLAGTTLTVKDIAHDLGYTSDHHFHACFRRRYQATPSAWRQRREP